MALAGGGGAAGGGGRAGERSWVGERRAEKPQQDEGDAELRPELPTSTRIDHGLGSPDGSPSSPFAFLKLCRPSG